MKMKTKEINLIVYRLSLWYKEGKFQKLKEEKNKTSQIYRNSSKSIYLHNPSYLKTK